MKKMTEQERALATLRHNIRANFWMPLILFVTFMSWLRGWKVDRNAPSTTHYSPKNDLSKTAPNTTATVAGRGSLGRSRKIKKPICI